MSKWAIDFGTTNSAVARWDDAALHPTMLHLPSICQEVHLDQKLEVHDTIPSSLFLLPGEDWRARLGRLPWIQRHFFLGQQALIGRMAVERDAGLWQANFVQGFKKSLLHDGYQTLTRVGGATYPAARVAQIFLRELLCHVKESTGERPREVVFSVPVDSFEPYRAQLRKMARQLGITTLRMIDEPVAAALGYGISISQPRNVLVVDFGGGTLDLALLRLEEHSVEAGHCEVLAKDGQAIGGSVVDAWLVAHFCDQVGYCLSLTANNDSEVWWYRIMLEEARRVKEGLYFHPKEQFFLTPPRELRRVPARLRQGGQLAAEVSLSRDDLIALLHEKGLYRALTGSFDRIAEQARARSITEDQIDEVLMVGGSTLLPRVYHLAEKRYGRDRVRAWQPFNAVAYGACAYAARNFVKSDFITHDYAFVTYRREADDLQAEYQTIVGAGTQFPTEGHVWKRQLTPTCARGEPETIFKLIIAELANRHQYTQAFVWDGTGRMHTLNEAESREPVVVLLNEDNPALGHLDPPHPPGDRSPRLEISFGISEDRWLWGTVLDLKTRKTLMDQEPVVRLK